MNEEMPSRDLGLWFSLDSNRINARQLDNLMNQLERWAQSGVIHLYMSEPAASEVRKGDSLKRRKKLSEFGPIMHTRAETIGERALLRKIADILSNKPLKNENEQRDVEIVFNHAAKKGPGILITEDGDSKSQPKGILGSRQQLKALGIDIWRTAEAVAFVRRRIEMRDQKARNVSARVGEPLPHWVGND